MITAFGGGALRHIVIGESTHDLLLMDISNWTDLRDALGHSKLTLPHPIRSLHHAKITLLL